jgi:hypothetical protein
MVHDLPLHFSILAKELLTSMAYIGVEVTACNIIYGDGVKAIEFLVEVILETLDGTVMKILSSKKLAQKIVCYFVADTYALVER